MMSIAQYVTSSFIPYAMPKDIEYRVMLARAMREAGASFELIAEILKERSRVAQQRQRLQSSVKHIRKSQIYCRQEVAAGMRHENARYMQIGTALNVSYTGARNLVQRAEKRATLPAWLNGLDLRTAKVLLRAGFQNAEEVRRAISAGQVIDRIQARRIDMIEAWLQAA